MKRQNQGEGRSYKPVKIVNSLRRINQKLLFKFGKIDYIIHAKWPEIVGVFFDKYSQPDKITTVTNHSLKESDNHRKILHVSVIPAAAVEFQHFQNKIIEKINSFFGYQAVHSIRIHQKLDLKNTSFKIENIKKQDDNFDQKKIEIKDTTHKINDKELGQSLLNLGISISKNEEE